MWQKFYERHRTNNFEILSIAVDIQGARVVRPYQEKYQVTFPVAVDAADIFGQAFDLKAIPVSFLVDEVGLIRLRGGGPSPEFLRNIEVILAEPASRVRAKSPGTEPVADLQARIDRNPEDWQAHVGLARQLALEKKYSAAMIHLENALKTAPQEPEIHFHLGQILLEKGDRSAALARLRQARDLAPDNWRIRKQIWAIEHPDKFYSSHSPDFSWQKEQIAREKRE